MHTHIWVKTQKAKKKKPPKREIRKKEIEGGRKIHYSVCEKL